MQTHQSLKTAREIRYNTRYDDSNYIRAAG